MKAILFFVGILLLPACWSVTATLVALVFAIQPGSAALVPAAVWAMSGGFALWVLIYLTLPRPMRTYVLAHELTHAFWAAMMGARVSGLHVGKDGGSVVVSESNVFIALAPYFFPLYTVIAVAAYYAASIFVDLSPYYPVWLGVVGFTWAFHVTFTLSMLGQHQSDIHIYGRLFSYAVIYALNVLGMIVWTVMVSPVTIEQAMATFVRTAGDARRDAAVLVRAGRRLRNLDRASGDAPWRAEHGAKGRETQEPIENPVRPIQ